jgi:hypothetical protein
MVLMSALQPELRPPLPPLQPLPQQDIDPVLTVLRKNDSVLHFDKWIFATAK